MLNFPYLNGKLCIGVGAAFRSALDEYKHPNKTIQKLGLTRMFWRKIGFKEVGVCCKWMAFLVQMGGFCVKEYQIGLGEIGYLHCSFAAYHQKREALWKRRNIE